MRDDAITRVLIEGGGTPEERARVNAMVEALIDTPDPEPWGPRIIFIALLLFWTVLPLLIITGITC